MHSVYYIIILYIIIILAVLLDMRNGSDYNLPKLNSLFYYIFFGIIATTSYTYICKNNSILAYIAYIIAILYTLLGISFEFY